MRMVAWATVGAVFVSGCATTPASEWRPMIDTQGGIDQVRYEQDLQECRAYAETNPSADPETAARDGAIRTGLGSAAITAVAGIATGGLALIPMALGAGATGLAAGAWGGTSQADIQYRNIVSNCLIGRGYRVIDSHAVNRPF